MACSRVRPRCSCSTSRFLSPRSTIGGEASQINGRPTSAIPDSCGRSRALSDVSLKRRVSPIWRRWERFLREPVRVRTAAAVIVAVTFILVVVSGIAMRLIDHREYPSV